MKNFSRLLILVLMAALSLTGCSQTPKTAESSAPAQKVRLILDWTPNTNHTGVFVAQQQGYYRDAGIDLEILGYSQAGVESVMGSKGADFGFSGADSILTAHASGIDLTMVMNVQQKSSFGIAVKADSPITRPSQLDGKTLAAYGAGADHYNTQQMIKNDGGKGTFDEVVVGTGALDAVVAGRADFAESMATWEGLQMEMQSTPVRFMFPADYGVPTTPALLGISVRNDLIDQNPELVKKFIQATQRGYQFAIDKPAEAAQILIDANPEAKLDPALSKRSQELLSKEYWPDEKGSVGHADVAAWQSYLDHVIGTGLITDASGKPFTTKVDATKLVSNDYLA